MIHILQSPPTEKVIDEMLEPLGTYIKLAVDIRRGVLAGGGILHADCEAALLEDGSRQDDVWGADWDPSGRTLTFEALINIRPRQGNPSMDILDSATREAVAHVVGRILGAE